MQKIGFFRIEENIVFLGLDNAGKTTYLSLASRSGRMTQANPTMHSNREEIPVDNVTFNATDLGGHLEARTTWKEFYQFMEGIVYMIDAADRPRLQESAAELNKILQDNYVKNLPIAVVVNKIDIPNSATEQEIEAIFGLRNIRTGYTNTKSNNEESPYQKRKLEVFMISLRSKIRHLEPLKWLVEVTKK